jgi:hypothetical protein
MRMANIRIKASIVKDMILVELTGCIFLPHYYTNEGSLATTLLLFTRGPIICNDYSLHFRLLAVLPLSPLVGGDLGSGELWASITLGYGQILPSRCSTDSGLQSLFYRGELLELDRGSHCCVEPIFLSGLPLSRDTYDFVVGSILEEFRVLVDAMRPGREFVHIVHGLMESLGVRYLIGRWCRR